MDKVFSPTENLVLKTLGKKKMTVADITSKIFEDPEKVMNPNAVVSSAIIRINKKCKFHKLSWWINSYGLGRAGKTVWLDKN